MNIQIDHPFKMESEQSLKEMDLDLKSGDQNTTGAADVLVSDQLMKPVELEEDHRQLRDTMDEQKLIQELQTEHKKLHQRNHQLQVKLAKHPGLLSGSKLQPSQENFANQDCTQIYADIFEEISRQRQDEEEKNPQLEELIQQHCTKLKEIKHESSLLASTMRKVMGHKDGEDVVKSALKCEEDLNRKIAMMEERGLHVREEDIEEEMSLIDFEQLKFENQNYLDQIEEYKEEVDRLNKLLPQHGQILMHVKEKLEFVQQKNQAQRVHLDELDILVLREQVALNQAMEAWRKLLIDNQRKKQEYGLMDIVLRDFEDTEDEQQALMGHVDMLKQNVKRRTQSHTVTYTPTSRKNTHAETQ